MIATLNDAAAVPTNSTTSLPSIPPDVRLVTLDHGLTLIIREDRSAGRLGAGVVPRGQHQ